MVQIMCEMLSKEKFVQISYITFFILQFLFVVSTTCAKKKGNKKGKKQKKLATSSRRDASSSSQISRAAKKKSSAAVISAKSSSKKTQKSGIRGASQISGAQSPAAPGAQDAAGGGVSAYQPPPYHERPRHPGFEAPIEDTEENKTEYQVNGFADAENF
ncbi:unnamed protein product [Caenorhabditis angaria]|uniref:Uncharacterized protein n=1 Tax=Caenorhabditis angaria TaxID=860376 RepID=A0A9P1N431_9PELO|nr:unnamed protein product [Caenorhabditis angaria]